MDDSWDALPTITPDSRMIWTLNEFSYIQVSFDPLRTGSTRLAVAGWVFSLSCDSVEDIHEDLRTRGVESEIVTDRDGDKTCVVKDPDGNAVTLHKRHIDAEHQKK